MNRFMKSMIATTLASIMCFTTACGVQGQTSVPGGEKNDEDHTNKTTLTVATFDGGLGMVWLEEAAERFEKKFADVSFEDGKKGVHVEVLKNRNYAGTSVIDTMKKESADVWFTEGVKYMQHLALDNFAEITDIVTEDLQEYGEKGSIEDKIDEDFREFLNVGTESEPKYYAIPFYDGFYGYIYDQELFAKNQLYFKSTGDAAGDAADNLGFVASEADTKSAGRDGKLGTYDDGLPATHAQFRSLLAKMVEKNITPFVYGGSDAMSYASRAMSSFWAQAEGKEGFLLNSQFSGTAEHLVKLDASGMPIIQSNGTPATESVSITENNGYELQRQASKYYVLSLFADILKNEKNMTDASMLQAAAEASFLKGIHEDFADYGLLIDGSWWENESLRSFEALESLYGEAYAVENRKLAWMPIPFATAEQVGTANTMLNQNDSLAFIRSTTEVLDCAKAFLQFTSTDAEMSAFTAKVSMTRAMKYDIVSEYEDKVSNYAKSLIEMKNDSDVVYNYHDNTLFVKNEGSFDVGKWAWTTTLNKSTYEEAWQHWISIKGKYSAEQYFAGMYEKQKENWTLLNR